MKKVSMIIIILMAMSATLWAVPVPVSHWTFDGNANDSGTYGNNGTIVGNPQFVHGRLGQAIQFDGDGDGVWIPNPSHYLDTTFSISFWINVPNDTLPYGIAVGKVIHNATTAPQGLGWNFMHEAVATHGYGLLMLNRAPGNVRRDMIPSFYDTRRDGRWHHVVAVIDASSDTATQNLAQMYVDGVLVFALNAFEKGIITDANVANQPLAFGYMPNGPSVWSWEGIIDDVQYFDYCLTGTEVNQILTAAGGDCLGLLGDANADCKVKIDDLAQVAEDWLKSGFYTE